MKVVLGAPAFPPVKGGASMYFRILYESLKNSQYEVTVITYGSYRNTDVRGIGIRRWYKFTLINFVLSFIVTFIKFINLKADVVHVHTTSGMNFALSILARMKKIPIIRDVRDLEAPRFIIKYPKADVYIVCCKSAINYLRQMGVEKERIVYIPPPVNIKLKDLNQYFNLKIRKNNCINLIYVGELTTKKGLKDFLEVIDDLRKRHKICVTIVGDGPLKKELDAYCKKIECIKYFGPCSNDTVLKLMSMSDILLLPSYLECYPRVVIEALFMGCVVLAYDVGDIKDIVSNAGIICKPNRESLKLCLEYLLSNLECISLLKRNARKVRVARHSDILGSIYKILKIYRSL